MSRKVLDSIVLNKVLDSERIAVLKYAYEGQEVDETKPSTSFPKIAERERYEIIYPVISRYKRLQYVEPIGEFNFNGFKYELPTPIVRFLKALLLEHVSKSLPFSTACVSVFMVMIQSIVQTKNYPEKIVFPDTLKMDAATLYIATELSKFYNKVVDEIEKC